MKNEHFSMERAPQNWFPAALQGACMLCGQKRPQLQMDDASLVAGSPVRGGNAPEMPRLRMREQPQRGLAALERLG
jgi:hypothetical protein